MIQEPKETGRQHPLARAAEVILFWVPVFVPLLLLAQLGTKGLRPALIEAKQLEKIDRDLDHELMLVEEQRVVLEAKRTALEDPIYLHRLELRRLEKERQIRQTSVQDEVPARKR